MKETLNNWRNIQVTITYGFLMDTAIAWFISVAGRSALIEILGKMPTYYGVLGVVVWATVIASYVFRFKYQNLFYTTLVNYAFFHGAVIEGWWPSAGIYAALLYTLFFVSELSGKTRFSDCVADKI